ncbi:bone morphogenetic protein 15 [Pleurodeles waltl]|uniref:bone morphogenetic protein 15 n=1 Tax=Pleurodeles waltl TaxID=8319 RepID=UPI00370946E0
MLRPSHFRLCFCFFLAVLFIKGLAEKEKAAGLKGLARVPALPLIQVLLEQLPPKPRVLWKRQVSSQHLNYMLNLYRKSADRDGRPKVNRSVDSNMVRLVKPFDTADLYVQDPWIVHTLQFHIEAFSASEQLVRAAIVYSSTLSLAGSWFSCKLELLVEGGVSSEHLLHSTKFNSRQWNTLHRNTFFKRWSELDITSYLKSLSWEPKDAPFQHIQVHYLCIRSEKMDTPLFLKKTKNETSHHLPFLLLYLNSRKSFPETEDAVPSLEKKTKTPKTSSHSRRARQAGNIGLKLPSYRQKNSISKTQCTLHSFRVSFHQMGWDHWIIAPHSYNPKYCKGDCPRVLHYGYNSPNHAIVQNFINELVDQSVPRPSCVPYKYSPISVLMIEANGSILYKEYENMIAESCTCR